MGIRGVWGSIKYDGDVVMAPPCGIIAKKMFWQNTVNNFSITLTHKTHKYSSPWITSIPGHPGFTRSQQQPHLHSLQKAHTYRSISTLGQQSFHHGQTQCFEHIGTQGQAVFSNQQSLHKELEHIRKALKACHFPAWTL